MAITVIKRVDPSSVVYELTCFGCTSVLRYHRADIKWCDAVGTNYICCPVCKCENDHKGRTVKQDS